jgi:hypothetical protein
LSGRGGAGHVVACAFYEDVAADVGKWNIQCCCEVVRIQQE